MRGAEEGGLREDGTNGKLRILIVTYAFPPMNSIASHRPYSWARVWRESGHEVHVLTPVKHGFDGAMDMQLDLEGIGVHQVDYLPLRRSKAGALPTGRSVRVKRWEWLKTLTRRIRFGLAMFGDLRLLAYFPMVRKGLQLIRSGDIDLIIATSPPEVSFFVARTLSLRSGIPWVADFRDLWFRDMRLYQLRITSWLSGPVNRWLVREAAALVTVSVGLQKRLSGYLGREVLISYNGFFESERQAASPGRPWDDDKIHIVYTGRLYPGKYDPEPLFRALSALRGGGDNPAGRISVDFYGFEDPWLRSMIAKYGVEDCVHLHGFVPYRESMALQRAADVLLFLDWTDAQAEGVLTGKLFEYLGSGRPILSLGRRRDSEAAALIAETECGTTLIAEEEIAAFLRKLAAGTRSPEVGSPARDRLSREKQARALLEALSARLFRPGPARHGTSLSR